MMKDDNDNYNGNGVSARVQSVLSRPQGYFESKQRYRYTGLSLSISPSLSVSENIMWCLEGKEKKKMSACIENAVGDY